MNRKRRLRIILLTLMLPPLVMPPSTTLAGLFGSHKPEVDGPITLEQAAAYVDLIDKRLFSEGTIGVKTPGVWGQNRLTKYRAEFEQQMATRLGSYQDILQAAQSRTDIATLTSATSLAATVAAVQSKGSSTAAPKLSAATTPVMNTTVVSPNTSAAATPSGGTTGGGSGGTTGGGSGGTTGGGSGGTTGGGSGSSGGFSNPAFGDLANQLTAISNRLDKLQSNALSLPMNINTFNNTGGAAGVGIEPTVQLDEEAGYINHLHQLRLINDGDDLTDMAGYGLYLLRMPVSLMPGPESRKGKGAVVTVEARHDLTDDLLPNTYRDIAILDLTYALTQLVNEQIHENIYNSCQTSPTPPGAGSQGNSPPPSKGTMKAHPGEPSKNIAGPNAALLEDLRIILGPLEKKAPSASPTPTQPAPPPHQPNPPSPMPPLPNVGRMPSQNANLSAPRASRPMPSTKPTVSRALPAGPGPIAKYDQVVRTSQTTPATPNTQNRLNTLVKAMVSSQRDPFRHDPSTLSLLQASLMDVYRYMRENSARVDLFQVPRIEYLGELLLRRDYNKLKEAREQFLYGLYCYRHQGVSPVPAFESSDWVNKVDASDVLAFALLLQFVNIDRQLKWDMKYMAQRRGLNYGDVDGLCFYEFEPSPEARNAFKEYVACKWPLRIYSIDPVVDQQNVLDAYSRRTELQLALAVAVSTGQFNINNLTTYARQLDLDLQTVGLNRTAVGFGAGDTTFGWMFYPRVQTPQPVSNFRSFTNLLTGTGQGINADLRSRRIEPGQRECIALMVTPNFIPSIKVSTVANWFDITGSHAKQRLSNQEMLAMSRMLQQAKDAVARACDSHQYRASDFIVLNQRIKQLEALLPTQDTRVDLPDESDLLGSEIFSSNAAGLSPALLAWYGEPIQEGTAGSIFLQGRGFSVTETQVIVGGIPLQQGPQFRLISRNVMQIIVPANANTVPVVLDPNAGNSMAGATSPAGGTTPATPAKPPTPAVASIKLPGVPTVEVRGGLAEVQIGANQRATAQLDKNFNPDVNLTVDDGNGSATVRGGKVDVQVGSIHAHAEGTPLSPAATPPTPKTTCDRSVIDVHIATPNGISNHLYVEVIPKAKPDAPKTPQNAVTTATTTTTVRGDTTTTSTRFETTPPGTVLPPLTVLPMGTNWPPATVLSPGAVTGSPAGSLMPGLVGTSAPAGTPTTAPGGSNLILLAPTPAPSSNPPASTSPTPSPSATPSAAPAPAASTPKSSAPAAGAAASPGSSGSASNSVSPGPIDGGVEATALAQGPASPGGLAVEEVATLDSPTNFRLPPLPPDPPKPVPTQAKADKSTPKPVRPAILRRIGLPDR